MIQGSLNSAKNVIRGFSLAIAALALTACNPMASESKIEDAFRPGLTMEETAPVSLAGFSYGGATFGLSVNSPMTSLVPSFTQGAATAYSVAPALPTGLVLNAVTGVISGTPTVLQSSAPYTVTASDGTLALTTTISISVASGIAAKLAFTTAPSATATAGSDFAVQPAVQIRDANDGWVASSTAVVTITAYTDSACTATAATGTLNGGSTSAVAGVATFSGIDYSKAETIYLKASSGTLTSACSTAVAVSAGPPSSANSSIVVSPSSLYADGSASASVTITLKDANLNPIPSVSATFAATGTGNSLTQPAAVTDSTGQASGSMTSTDVGVKTISIASPSGLASLTASVTFIDPVPNAGTSAIQAVSGSVAADGSTTSTVTVTLRNAAGDLLSGKTVALVSSRGATDTISSPSPSLTNASGQTSFTIKSSTIGVSTLTASVPAHSVSLAKQVRVSFLSASPLVDYQAQSPNGFLATLAASLSSAWKNLSSSAVTHDGAISGYSNTVNASYAATVLADSPAGYWRLGEKGGTVAYDSASNGLNGTYVNSPTLGSVHTGNGWRDPDTAASFDGTDDYVSIPNHASLNSMSALTLEAWVYPTSFPASGSVIVCKSMTAAGSAPADPYQLYTLSMTGTGAVNFGVSTGTSGSRVLLTSSGSLALNTWTHVVAVYDGSVMRIYFDSVADANTASTSLTIGTNSQNVRIGAFMSSTSASVFAGRIDDVAIYRSALTSAQISTHYAARASAWIGAGSQRNPLALLLDGASQFVGFGAGTNANTDLAFETWVKPSATTSGSVILTNGETANSGTASETNRGFTLRQSRTSAGKIELFTGQRNYSDEVLADAPLAYWRLGERAGPVAYDASGNGYHGTYANVTLGQTRAWGDSDRASGFNGSSSRIGFGDILDSAFAGAGKKFSIEAWVKPGVSTMTNHMILTKYGYTSEAQREFLMRIFTSGKVQFFWYTSLSLATYRSVLGSTPITDTNRWYHIVVTYDGTIATNGGLDRVKIYVDGVADTTTLDTAQGALGDIQDGTAYLSSGTALNSSGATQSSPTYLNGTVDEIAVYGDVLSASRVAAHFEAARKRISCATASAISSGSWHHLSGSFDSSGPTLNLFVDGIPQCSVTLAGAGYDGATNELRAGKSSAGSSFWAGAMAELRSFSTALSASNIETNRLAKQTQFPSSDFLKVTSGMKLWLRADEISGLTDVTRIVQWNDASSVGNHAAQSTAANRPTLESDAASLINGRPVVRFDGNSTFFGFMNGAIFPANFTAFVVFRTSQPTKNYQMFFGTTTSDVANFFSFSSTTGKLYLGAGPGVGSGVIAANTPYLATFDSSAALRLNGSLYKSGSALNWSGFSWLMGKRGDGYAFEGDFAEVLVYDSVLSAADRESVQDYLNAKYSLW